MAEIGANYIYVDIGKSIGNFEAHYGLTERDSLPHGYCFAKLCENTNDETLVAGQYQDGIFYECPIVCFFVKIIRVSNIKREYENYGNIDLQLFDKDYTNYRNINIRLIDSFDFSKVCSLINFLNKYIHAGNSVDFLDLDKLPRRYIEHKSVSVERLIELLQIDFYDDCTVNVGRDNHYWREAVISTVGNNKYFTELLVIFFNETYGSCSIENDNIVSCIESENAYASSHGRIKVQEPQLDMFFRIKIAVWMGKNYNDDAFTYAEYKL